MIRSTGHWTLALSLLLAAQAPAAEAPPELVWEHSVDIDGRGDDAVAAVTVGDTLISVGQGALSREPGLQQRDDAMLIQGLRAATGQVLWTRRLDSTLLLALLNDGNRVFVATRNSSFAVKRRRLPPGGRLMALEPDSGETLWEVPYREPDRRTTGFELAFVEATEKLLVYGGSRSDAQGSGAPFVQARDAATGRLVWEHLEPLRPGFTGGIAFAASARGRLFVAGVRSGIEGRQGFAAAWSVHRGSRLWEIRTESPAAIAAQGRRCALVERLPSARNEDRLRLLLLHARSGRSLSESRFENRPRHALGHVRLATSRGSVLLAIDDQRTRFPSQHEALLFAVSSRTGALKWQRQIELGRHLGINLFRAHRGILLLQFTDGFFDDGEALDRIYALAPNDGETLWTLTVPDAWLSGVERTDDGWTLLLGRLKGPFPLADMLLRALR